MQHGNSWSGNRPIFPENKRQKHLHLQMKYGVECDPELKNPGPRSDSFRAHITMPRVMISVQVCDI